MARYRRPVLAALALSVSIIGSMASLAASADGYLSVVPDMPLPKALHEVAESALVFDKPDGSLIQVRAVGKLTIAEVKAFYQASLPPLGWHLVTRATRPNRLSFHRDKESVSLTMARRQQQIQVDFQFAPRTTK